MSPFIFSTLYIYFLSYSSNNLCLGVPVEKDVSTIVNAISRLIDYYKTNYKSMNLDGIYGLRLLEGQLETFVAKNQYNPNSNLLKSTTNQLLLMIIDAKEVTALSIPHIKSDSPEYYEHLRPLIEKSNSIYKPYRLVDTALQWKSFAPPEEAKKFNEDSSDRCINQLTSTNSTHKGCLISKDCFYIMTMKGLRDYAILHQLLYTMLVEQWGCLEKLEALLLESGQKGGVNQLQVEMCSNVFIEMATAVKILNGTIIPVYQDLFMEQLFACPILGFAEFIHKDWIAQILSWQYKSGCFGRMQRRDPDSFDPDDEFENFKKLVQKKIKFGTSSSIRKSNFAQQKIANDLNSNGHFNRKLLVEKVLKDGCFAHKSAVAAGALSQILKYLIDPSHRSLNSKWQNQNALLKVGHTLDFSPLKKSILQQLNPKNYDDWLESRKKAPPKAQSNEDNELPDSVNELVDKEKLEPEGHKQLEFNDDGDFDGLKGDSNRKEFEQPVNRRAATPYSNITILLANLIILFLLVVVYKCVRRQRILIRYMNKSR